MINSIKKIIKKCWKISDEESINLRQSYVRIVKSLGITQRLKSRKNGAKEARRASKRIKTIAGRLLRDLRRKLAPERLEPYLAYFNIAQRILNQKRGDGNKIYSIHEPDV